MSNLVSQLLSLEAVYTLTGVVLLVFAALTFSDRRPKSFWEALQAAEYGFWANVNPEVPHPRWSQATEELIGRGGERRPTLLFNGYGDYVAHLYKDLPNTERLWA